MAPLLTSSPRGFVLTGHYGCITRVENALSRINYPSWNLIWHIGDSGLERRPEMKPGHPARRRSLCGLEPPQPRREASDQLQVPALARLPQHGAAAKPARRRRRRAAAPRPERALRSARPSAPRLATRHRVTSVQAALFY